MQKFFLVTSFFLIPITLVAQTDDIEGKLKAQGEQKKLEEEANKEIDTLTTDYYKIYYLDGRIETVDTTLNITKDYKFNFTRKDNFELIKMSNVGHTYNNLGYNFSHNDYPKMGALGKHFNYFEKDEMLYLALTGIVLLFSFVKFLFQSSIFFAYWYQRFETLD